MDGDRLIGRVALVEIIALEHASHSVLRSQADEVGGAHLIHPGGVECHFSPGRIENLEHLGLVGLGIFENLLTSQRRTRCTLAARIANHPGEVANQEDHLVTQFLELAQLIDKHGVAQVQIRGGRIEAGLDT